MRFNPTQHPLSLPNTRAPIEEPRSPARPYLLLTHLGPAALPPRLRHPLDRPLSGPWSPGPAADAPGADGRHGPGRAPTGRTLAVLRPIDGPGAAWEARSRTEEPVAVLRAWSIGPPTAATYGEARYELEIGPGAGDDLRPLLLALPVLADRTAQGPPPAA